MAPVAEHPGHSPDAALSAAALGFCALAFAATGLVGCVRREAGLA